MVISGRNRWWRRNEPYARRRAFVFGLRVCNPILLLHVSVRLPIPFDENSLKNRLKQERAEAPDDDSQSYDVLIEFDVEGVRHRLNRNRWVILVDELSLDG